MRTDVIAAAYRGLGGTAVQDKPKRAAAGGP
jgi:hypothetical protein